MAAHVRRRIAVLLVLVAVVGAAVTIALVATSGDGGPAVPEGGSAYGAAARAGDDETLLDALAPLLSTNARTSRRGSGAAGGAARPAARRRPARVTDADLAQLFLVGFRGTRTDDPFLTRLAARRWGAVMVDHANYENPDQLRSLTTQLAATLTGEGAPAPLIVADQGGGAENTLPGLGPAAPQSVTSADAAGATARDAAHALRALGVRMAMAPNADIGYSGGAWEGRAFSDDPAQVRRRVDAAVRGWRTLGLAPAVGHFPGEGAASQDPSDGPATVGLGLPDLEKADLAAFAGALRDAPALVMSNALYAAYDGVTPATLLPEVPALARRHGFHGVVVSGNLAVTVLAAGGSIADAAVDALKAGCDLLWIPGDAGDQEAAYRAVVHAVRTGAIPRSRAAGALARVTALKRRFVK